MTELPRRLSKCGPLIEYIAMLQKAEKGKAIAEKVIDAVRATLGTPEGAILLDFLEKATVVRSVSIDADPRALDAINAQGFIALDLRRILNDEFDAKQTDEISTGVRTGRRRGNPPA